MYFPQQNILKEVLPPEEPLPALTDDPNFLSLFKQHCALPSSVQFTSKDLLLELYVSAAETYIDKFCCPYRPRQIRLNLCGTSESSGASKRAVNFYGRQFSGIRLPFGPILETPVVSFIDDEGNTTEFVEGDDFFFTGGYSLRPEINFTYAVEWPCLYKQPYPFRVEFTSGADRENLLQKMAIMMLGSYYFRNPDAMGEETPNVGAEFRAVLSSLQASFL